MLSKSIKYFKAMGPAWIISAVACGPATLASISIAGATHGYTMLWVVIMSAVLGATTQYLAAKIGVLEGQGIIRTTETRLGNVWSWILTIDALVATWLAAIVLMSALSGVTSLVTGINTPWWGVFYGSIIGFFLVFRGYRGFETLCKLLVAFVVGCFFVTLFMADFSPGQALSGLIPTIPAGVNSALMMAAIMGGAVHITIIGMHTYNTNAKGWQRKDLGLAFFDTLVSMGFAFGLYSLAIFLVAASVLHPNAIKVTNATSAALALEPLLGKHAMVVFMLGLWGAAFSTLSPTFLAGAYFLSDKLGWELNVKDKRFSAVLLTGCAISMLGPFIKGSFFLLLPIMLAVGLTGTPLIIAIIMYLLNHQSVNGGVKNSLVLNCMGLLSFSITAFLGIRFVVSKLASF